MTEMTFPTTTDPLAALQQRLSELRPRLHRYCARMTGSVIDAEDVVQEACIKAINALSEGTKVAHADAWLFRIAHHAALDFLRRRKRLAGFEAETDLEGIADPVIATEERQEVSAGLRAFMHLPALPRSCVILMDVLGYSLEEITVITESSLPAVKAALHRGRVNLRKWAAAPEDKPLPVLPQAEQNRLRYYIERFNARDFDAIREMLADDVRLDLVGRMEIKGRQEVERYFTNYQRLTDWHLNLGTVERRLALLVTPPPAVDDEAPPVPIYFVLLDWQEDRLSNIRDFYHGRYVVAEADWAFLP
jgi:RNA polymerase sigma-70 factor (ECF subfamily)